MYHYVRSVLGVVVCVAMPAVLACVNPELSQRDYSAVGVVKNSDGKIIYQEHHQHLADIKGGISQVEYISTDDLLIAKKHVDYDCRANAPSYTLTMKQGSGWVEQVEWQSEKLVVTQPEGSETLDDFDSSKVVIDVGFDNFVIQHWQALIAGGQKDIDFLHVPGNRLFPLVIERVVNDAKFDISDQVALFKVSPKNRFFRIFSDPIYLAYDKNSKRLDYYYGPTNLRGDIRGLEKSKQVAIKYHYN